MVPHTPSHQHSDRQKVEYGFHTQHLITRVGYGQIGLRYTRIRGRGRLRSICEKPSFASGQKQFLKGKKPPPVLLKRVKLKSDPD